MDPDQKLRLEQLDGFAERYKLNLSTYDYILVEGSVKCAGCAQVWPERLLGRPLLTSPVLVICNDVDLPQQFGLKDFEIHITEYDSIERAFPYIANYFVFYRSEGKFSGYVELGARNLPIPESTY